MKLILIAILMGIALTANANIICQSQTATGASVTMKMSDIEKTYVFTVSHKNGRTFEGIYSSFQEYNNGPISGGAILQKITEDNKSKGMPNNLGIQWMISILPYNSYILSGLGSAPIHFFPKNCESD